MDEPINRILIIDDDPRYRNLVREILMALFPAASLRETGETEEARAQLASSDFDCVVIDYRLGHETGLELLQESLNKSVPTGMGVVMLTGEGNEDVAVSALKAGAHDYLVKEALTSAQLYRAIRGASMAAGLERRAFLQRQVLEGLAGMIAADIRTPLRHLVERLEGLVKAGDTVDETVWREELTACLSQGRSLEEALQNLTFLTEDGSAKDGD